MSAEQSVGDAPVVELRQGMCPYVTIFRMEDSATLKIEGQRLGEVWEIPLWFFDGLASVVRRPAWGSLRGALVVGAVILGFGVLAFPQLLHAFNESRVLEVWVTVGVAAAMLIPLVYVGCGMIRRFAKSLSDSYLFDSWVDRRGYVLVRSADPSREAVRQFLNELSRRMECAL